MSMPEMMDGGRRQDEVIPLQNPLLLHLWLRVQDQQVVVHLLFPLVLVAVLRKQP